MSGGEAEFFPLSVPSKEHSRSIKSAFKRARFLPRNLLGDIIPRGCYIYTAVADASFLSFPLSKLFPPKHNWSSREFVFEVRQEQMVGVLIVGQPYGARKVLNYTTKIS